MAKTRRTEKAVEIHEFYVIRSTSGSLPALCVECSSGDAFMVAPEQAAAVAHVPLRDIYRGVESGLVHYTERTGWLAGGVSQIVDHHSQPDSGRQIT